MSDNIVVFMKDNKVDKVLVNGKEKKINIDNKKEVKKDILTIMSTLNARAFF